MKKHLQFCQYKHLKCVSCDLVLAQFEYAEHTKLLYECPVCKVIMKTCEIPQHNTTLVHLYFIHRYYWNEIARLTTLNQELAQKLKAKEEEKVSMSLTIPLDSGPIMYYELCLKDWNKHLNGTWSHHPSLKFHGLSWNVVAARTETQFFLSLYCITSEQHKPINMECKFFICSPNKSLSHLSSFTGVFDTSLPIHRTPTFDISTVIPKEISSFDVGCLLKVCV